MPRRLGKPPRITRRGPAVEANPPANPRDRVRGEYSISAACGIPVDVVAGQPERGTRRRTSAPPVPVEEVHLAALTERELTVIVKGKPITLERHDALALATIILTSFG